VHSSLTQKKIYNPCINDKCTVDPHEDGNCDHSKGSARDVIENSTNDRAENASKSVHQENIHSISSKNDITVSKLSGSNSTCVVGTGRVEIEDDGDVWETVEHKSTRTNGKNKKDSITNPTMPASPGSIMKQDALPVTSMVSSPSGRGKAAKSKKRNSRRQSIKQTAKEIITNLIQTAEEEIRKEIIENSNTIDRKSSALVFEQSAPVSVFIDEVRTPPSNELSALSNYRKVASASNLSTTTFAEVARLSLRNNDSNVVTSQCKDNAAAQGVHRPVPVRDSEKLKLQKCTTSSSADHNTAQTCPETVSGVSGASNSSLTPVVTGQKIMNEVNIKGSVVLSVAPQNNSPTTYETHRNESFESSDEGEPNFSADSDISGEAPPLLLGPGFTNSATSSVASSLEAPHAIRRSRYINSSSCKEDDVGYHLLKVCEKLSEEMNTFMIRRASALTQRRQERATVLAALQDIAQVRAHGDEKKPLMPLGFQFFTSYYRHQINSEYMGEIKLPC